MDVAGGVAWRQLHNALTNPVIFLPSLAFPLLNFAAFAGGLAKVQQVPGFTFAEYQKEGPWRVAFLVSAL